MQHRFSYHKDEHFQILRAGHCPNSDNDFEKTFREMTVQHRNNKLRQKECVVHIANCFSYTERITTGW